MTNDEKETNRMNAKSLAPRNSCIAPEAVENREMNKANIIDSK